MGLSNKRLIQDMTQMALDTITLKGALNASIYNHWALELNFDIKEFKEGTN